MGIRLADSEGEQPATQTVSIQMASSVTLCNDGRSCAASSLVKLGKAQCNRDERSQHDLPKRKRKKNEEEHWTRFWKPMSASRSQEPGWSSKPL